MEKPRSILINQEKGIRGNCAETRSSVSLRRQQFDLVVRSCQPLAERRKNPRNSNQPRQQFIVAHAEHCMDSIFCEIGRCVGFERALLLYGVSDVVLTTVGMFTRTSIGCWKGTGNEASVVPISRQSYAVLVVERPMLFQVERVASGQFHCFPLTYPSPTLTKTVPRKPRLSLRSVFESGVFSVGTWP